MNKPIVFVTGYHDGYPVVQPTDGAAVLPVGMALYDHPAPDDNALMLEVLTALEEIHEGNMTPMAEQCWRKAIIALRDRLGDGE